MANIQIDITENGTTTLATEGKFCDRNIDVNVNVASSGGSEAEDGLIDGTISGDYRNDRVTSVRNYAFYGCYKLTSIELPNVTSAGSLALYACNELRTAKLPLLGTVNTQTFTNCVELTYVYIPSTDTIRRQAFYNCRKLVTVILGGTSVCYLENTSAFDNCYHILGLQHSNYNPEGLKDGYIYVPKNLIEQYKVATNWATYADQFRAIEDYPEITGG